MTDALQLGLSVSDFWAMSARAIVVLQREDLRRKAAQVREKARGTDGRGRRLDRIPRP